MLKKPALQASVAQLEEQVGHYKSFAASLADRFTGEKDRREKAHKEELEALRKNVAEETTQANKKEFEEKLLSLTKFLAAAAAMRHAGESASNESRAFEGVLYQVYGGSSDAVASILKLVDGADEQIASVEGETLDVTCKLHLLFLYRPPSRSFDYCCVDDKVKKASYEYSTTVEAGATEEAAPNGEAASATDPTLANAGLTELQDTSLGTDTAAANGTTTGTQQVEEENAPPAQTIVSDAANSVATSSWKAESGPIADTNKQVPRPPAETENGLEATPAAVDSGSTNEPTVSRKTGSWAEDSPTVPESSGTKETPVDGFEQVVHHQRQPSTRGSGRGRGRGRGDGFRGRGRGDFRGRGGRGRGDNRGGRGRSGFGGQQNQGASNGSGPAQGSQ